MPEIYVAKGCEISNRRLSRGEGISRRGFELARHKLLMLIAYSADRVTAGLARTTCRISLLDGTRHRGRRVRLDTCRDLPAFGVVPITRIASIAWFRGRTRFEFPGDPCSSPLQAAPRSARNHAANSKAVHWLKIKNPSAPPPFCQAHAQHGSSDT
jgi:hypothetical protein